MATTTISIDLEAYRRLKGIQKPDESFSQTIKRVVPKRIDLDEWFAAMDKQPISHHARRAIEEQIKKRHLPARRDR